MDSTGSGKPEPVTADTAAKMRNRVVDITSIGLLDLRTALQLAMAGRKVSHWSLAGPTDKPVLVLFAEKADSTQAHGTRAPLDIDGALSVVIPWLNAEMETFIEDDRGGVGYGFRVFVGPDGRVEGHPHAVCGIRPVRADYGAVEG